VYETSGAIFYPIKIFVCEIEVRLKLRGGLYGEEHFGDATMAHFSEHRYLTYTC
jgi:hypothetical protein